MRIHFLFPSHPLKPTAVDEMFADQRAALADAGFSTSLCPDAAIQGGKPLRNVPAGAAVIYRGWMLDSTDYAKLSRAILAASATPFTSPEAYLAAHHLPNWYPVISEFTPETRVFPPSADFEAELLSLGWGAFFLKDYVKALKTSVGSIIHDPSEVGAVIAEMKRVRGEMEGGLCVRRVEAFIAGTERRYFVVGGRPYSASDGPAPELVGQVAARIPSPFFSVDIIEREDGVLRVVEVGDGQVSDLVGWSAPAFAAMWAAVRPTTPAGGSTPPPLQMESPRTPPPAADRS